MSVDADDVVLKSGAVDGLSHVGDEYRLLAFGLERHAIERLSVGDLGVRVEVVVHGTEAHVASRQDQIRQVRGAHDIHRAEFMGLEL
jgi:hypothetical protein